MVATAETRSSFLKEFLMGRQVINPRDFGIDMSKDEFTDVLVSHLETIFHGSMTIDELCLHPREALNFCDMVRRDHGWLYLPDDVILRSIMIRRKNP